MSSHRLRQIVAVARMDLAKNLLSMRAAVIYLLAAFPVFVLGISLVMWHAFGEGPGEFESGIGMQMKVFFAIVYQFMIRFLVYAGCVWIFMNLFRGEVLDRSLHYYFLAPIRREVLVLGKFLSGWIATSVLFAGATLVSFLLVFAHGGPARAVRYVLSGDGMGQLIGYLTVTLLACLGYGAVFLVMGLFLRSPIVPALVIFLWEQANPYLPALLKKISVIFYLNSLRPVAINEGPFAIIADPVPGWLAVSGLFLFTAAVLCAAALRIRRMEIVYGSD
jgi:hypothetical protein